MDKEVYVDGRPPLSPCSAPRFLPAKRHFFFSHHCREVLADGGGKWSRPAPREKCQEMTSVVNWRYSKKYRIKVGRSVGWLLWIAEDGSREAALQSGGTAAGSSAV